MAEKLTLDLEHRELKGKKVNRLRRAGLLPATVYGKGVEPVSVQVDARTFGAVLKKAGRTALVELNIPGRRKQSAFIHVLQRHPVTRAIIHADLRVVDLLTELSVEVPIHAIGESELVKRGDALLNQVLSTLEVRALPTNIPQSIDVDISVLDDLDKNIHVRDIMPPDKVTIMTDGDELIFSVTPPIVEAEPEAEGEQPTEAEVIGRGKADDEEE
jgi:large subunit ribosomal protein L25